MKIFFQTKKLSITPYDQDFMARKLENLSKFFSPYAQAYVDIEHTKGGRFDGDLYYVSIKISDGETHYFTDEYQDDMRKSFDHAFGDIFRMIRTDRSRSRRLMHRAGRQFKKVFKRRYR